MRPLHAVAAVDVNARLAVCSRSLQPSSADDLFAKFAATGVSRIQIALDPIREDAKGAWAAFAAREYLERLVV